MQNSFNSQENKDDTIFDDCGTYGERDQNEPRACKTNSCCLEANENPDTLAGAVGEDLKKQATGKIGRFRSMEYKIRALRATALANAIAFAHPDDARQLLTAALIDLSAGMPEGPNLIGEVREDARWWSGMATPTELLEYMAAALRELGQKALCRTQRKQLFAVLWDSFPQEDRIAFLSRVDQDGTFRRAAQ